MFVFGTAQLQVLRLYDVGGSLDHRIWDSVPGAVARAVVNESVHPLSPWETLAAYEYRSRGGPQHLVGDAAQGGALHQAQAAAANANQGGAAVQRHLID